MLAAARERFPDLWVPGRSDLCFATTNRQDALIAVARRSDAVVVIGSSNSSNTRALEKVAAAAGCPRVDRVDHAHEVPADLGGVVGVTAGASAPEELVQAVVARLAPRAGVEEVTGAAEDEYFPLPRELRELVRWASKALTSAGADAGTDPVATLLAEDRATAASDVLAALGDT